MFRVPNFTFIVILRVIADLFLQRRTVRAVPAVEAFAFPVSIIGNSTLSMASASSWTSFQCAVSAVPTRHAETGTILALSVVAAAGITQLRCTELSSPSRITHARFSYASAVRTTIQIAYLCKNKTQSEMKLANMKYN